MGRQETRTETGTPDQLGTGRIGAVLVNYWWVDGPLAVRQYRNGHPIFVSLKKGHALASEQMFIDGLLDGSMFVLMMPNYCSALVEWNLSHYGKTLNILTVTGDLQYADEALEAIISAAEHAGAKMIFSVGKTGWKEIVERHGFTTKPSLFMQKVL